MMLYIIRGLPGSGKTTLANTLQESGVVDATASADDYMVDDSSNYSFDPEKLSQCHTTAYCAAASYLMDGKSVAVHNTFSRLWEMAHYIELAKKLGIQYTIITCEGNYGSIHNVPQHTINNMKARWETV